MDFDELSGHSFEEITSGDRPPADEEGPEMDEERSAEQPTVFKQPTAVAQPPAVPGRPDAHPTSGRRMTELFFVDGHAAEPPAEGKRTVIGRGSG